MPASEAAGQGAPGWLGGSRVQLEVRLRTGSARLAFVQSALLCERVSRTCQMLAVGRRTREGRAGRTRARDSGLAPRGRGGRRCPR
jgi:hypothetical protein